MKTRLALVISVAFGILAIVLTRSYLTGAGGPAKIREDSVRIIVAKKDIRRGTPVSKAMVASRKMPRKFLHRQFILAEDFELILDQNIKNRAGAGAPLLWSDFEIEAAKPLSDVIIKGKRAITIGVDELSSVAGMVSQGDHVDILGTFALGKTPEGPAEFTAVLLQDVTVIGRGLEPGMAEPLSFGPASGRRGYSSLTLLVSPEEAELIVFAQAHSAITLSLRHPDDREIKELPVIDFDYLRKALSR